MNIDETFNLPCTECGGTEFELPDLAGPDSQYCWKQLKLEKITAQPAKKRIFHTDDAAHEKTQPQLHVDLTHMVRFKWQ